MVKEGKIVSLKYSLRNKGGEEIEKTEDTIPFTYLHGAQQIVPGLEMALESLKVGDRCRVILAPEDAYGEIDSELKMAMDRAAFPREMKIVPGVQFQATFEDGDEGVFRVEHVEGDTIHVDGNHPLAGETLYFDVEVLDVRDPTPEEVVTQKIQEPGVTLH